MTKEQIKHHKESMLWFINNPDKGVWSKRDNNNWNLTTTPIFKVYAGLSYVPNDEYFMLRRAYVEGKIIQLISNGIWEDLDKPDWTEALKDYRIKPDEPKFKVGDWVRNIFHVNWIICLEDNDFNNEPNYENIGEQFELWEPNVDEWCVFWDDNYYCYVIQQFKRKVNNFYHTNTSGTFKNIAPLEFAQTLKN